jgi:hypothetical protein
MFAFLQGDAQQPGVHAKRGYSPTIAEGMPTRIKRRLKHDDSFLIDPSGSLDSRLFKGVDTQSRCSALGKNICKRVFAHLLL